MSGTFHANGTRRFWNISGYDDVITIDVVDEPYSQVIISVEDPADTVERINAAVQGGTGSGS